MSPRLRPWATHSAVTLIEMMIGFSLIVTILGAGFTFFTRGNQYSAKGAWRVQSSAKMRNALRSLKDRLERATYPSVVQVANFIEDSSDPYALRFDTPTSTGPVTGTPLTARTYSAAGAVVSFHVSMPRREMDATVQAGRATRVAVSLEAGTTLPDRKRLVMREDDAPVTATGTTVTVGTYGAPVTTVLVEDVEDVVMSTSDSREKSVVHVTLHTRDPFDGRLVMTETARAMVNVRVLP